MPDVMEAVAACALPEHKEDFAAAERHIGRSTGVMGGNITSLRSVVRALNTCHSCPLLMRCPSHHDYGYVGVVAGRIRRNGTTYRLDPKTRRAKKEK